MMQSESNLTSDQSSRSISELRESRKASDGYKRHKLRVRVLQQQVFISSTL